MLAQVSGRSWLEQRERGKGGVIKYCSCLCKACKTLVREGEMVNLNNQMLL